MTGTRRPFGDIASHPLVQIATVAAALHWAHVTGADLALVISTAQLRGVLPKATDGTDLPATATTPRSPVEPR